MLTQNEFYSPYFRTSGWLMISGKRNVDDFQNRFIQTISQHRFLTKSKQTNYETVKPRELLRKR